MAGDDVEPEEHEDLQAARKHALSIIHGPNEWVVIDYPNRGENFEVVTNAGSRRRFLQLVMAAFRALLRQNTTPPPGFHRPSRRVQ